jgi:hypothetical protein
MKRTVNAIAILIGGGQIVFRQMGPIPVSINLSGD